MITAHQATRQVWLEDVAPYLVLGGVTSFAPAITVPGAPVSLALGTATSSTQPLSWSTPASDGGAAITGYNVYYALHGGGYSLFGNVAGLSTTVTGLAGSTSYDYYVTAVNSVGEGPASNIATGSTAPAIYLQDNFTDADGTNLTAHTMDIGSGWTALAGSTWVINTNEARLSVSGGGQNSIVADAGYADGSVYATCINRLTAFDGGILCNGIDTNNYWLLQASNSGTWILYEHVGGGFTSRASGTYTFPGSLGTFVIKLVANGDSISVYFDGVLKTTYTVASRPLKTATKCGMRLFYGQQNYQDFYQVP